MKHLIALLISLLPCLLIAQDEFIFWNPNTPIEWSDFQGSVLENVPMHAMTASGLNVASTIGQSANEGSIELNIGAIFSRKLSWTDGQNKERLLNHERMHFAITEWTKRQFIQALKNYPFTRNFKQEFEDLYNQYNDLHAQLQEDYDQETNHSTNLEEQQEWNDKINTGINELDQYKNGEFTIIVIFD